MSLARTVTLTSLAMVAFAGAGPAAFPGRCRTSVMARLRTAFAAALDRRAVCAEHETRGREVIFMQLGLNEAALFAAVFFAAYYLHPVSAWCFTALNHWAAGLALWTILVSLLFAPSLYVSSHLTGDRRGTIFLGGMIGGAVLYKFTAWRRRRRRRPTL